MEMSDQEIIDRIRKVLVEEFELREEDLASDAALQENLGLDSLDSVDLVVALEKAFGFKVVRATDEEQIRAIRIIEDIQSFVRQKLDAALTQA
jgi:acyl carrier protein